MLHSFSSAPTKELSAMFFVLQPLNYKQYQVGFSCHMARLKHESLLPAFRTPSQAKHRQHCCIDTQCYLRLHNKNLTEARIDNLKSMESWQLL